MSILQLYLTNEGLAKAEFPQVTFTGSNEVDDEDKKEEEEVDGQITVI